MLDYYKILGIPQNADYPTIKAAYKQLALKYHPDRNPGNKAAEEYFKVVNEAHQLLSKPEKKAQYDLLLQYYYIKYSPVDQSQSSGTTTYRQAHRTNRSIYDRYGKRTWEAPRYKAAPNYRVDRNYFKIQFITLASVALVSIFIIGIFKYNQYVEELKAAKLRAKNEKVLEEAKRLYNGEQYRLALNMVENLIRTNPIEPQFYHEKEMMVASLADLTSQLYQKAKYTKAIKNLEVLRDYQTPQRLATWRMIADCNFKLNEYKKAIHALEYILMRDKNNIELLLNIGDIYFNNLSMPDKALQYYTEAKYIFKEFQSAYYGEAFELIMPVEDTPETYYDLFMKRAEANLALADYEEATTDYNWAIYLRPQRAMPYLYRGDCWQKQNYHEKACRDWRRALELGHLPSRSLINKLCK